MPLEFEKVDLGAFGINEDQPDEDHTRLSSTLSEATKVNPDEYARTSKLSKESGVPAFAVEQAPDEVEQNLRFKNIDLSTMSKRSPNTAKYLVDFNNAAIAHDDTDNLELLEGALTTVADIGRSLPAGLMAGFGAASEGSARTLEAVTRLATRGVDALLPESLDRFLYLQPDTPDILRAANRATDLTPGLRILSRGLKGAAEVTAPPEERQNLATDISSAVGQISGQVLTHLVAPGAATGLMFAQGVDQQGERQEVTGTEGSNAVADLALLAGGGITAVTEKVGLDNLLDRIPPKIKNDILRRIADLSLAGGLEAVQEVSEGILQGLLEKFTTNPDAEIFEGLEREALVAGGAGAIFRGLVSLAIPGRARDLAEQEIAIDAQSQVEQHRLDQINIAAERSKTRGRDKESFKQFVETADGDNNTHVFVDGPQLALYLQEKTPDEIAQDPALKLLQESSSESAAIGTDASIPVSEFATEIAGTPHYEQLRDSMTLSTETTSPMRQEQQRQETENYVGRLVEDAQKNASEFVEAQVIYDQVKAQLVDSGTVNSQNAGVMAQVVPAWATAFAKREGIGVQEAYQRSGLTIEGPQTGKKAELSEEALKQEAVADGPQLSTIEGGAIPTIGVEEITGDAAIQQFEQFSAQQLSNPYAEEIEISDVPSPEEGRADRRERQEAIFLSSVPEGVRHHAEGTATQRAISVASDKVTEQIAGDAAAPREVATGLGPFSEYETSAVIADDLGGKQLRIQIYGKEQVEAELDDAPVMTIVVSEEGALTIYGPPASSPQYQEMKDKGWVEDSWDAAGGVVFGGVDGGAWTRVKGVKRKELIDLLGDTHARTKLARGDEFTGLFWNRATGAAGGQSGTRSIFFQRDVDLPDGADVPRDKQAKGYYEPGNSIIRLTEASDLSTFLHEFAHFMYETELNADSKLITSVNDWYKRNAGSVAESASKGEGLDVTAGEVEAFIDKGATGESDKDRSIRRALHEQFARGFETYLMEGKAPSIELRNAFRTFARWLANVYRTFRGQLNPNLDNEMRQVFDRLLATEEQIEAAEARARYEPMFTDAAMAGMTEKQFQDYQQRQAKVKDVQSEDLREKMIKQLTRQTQAWWKLEKQDIIDEELKTLRGEQVYVARERLRTGDLKLDRATVKQLRGTPRTDKLGRTSIVVPDALSGMTATGQVGVHPDEAAAFFGYNSGSEMLDDLITSPKIGDAAAKIAEQEMIERHGDILNDGTIEREADDAVQNEERGKLLLAELKILAKGTQAPTIDRKTVKDLAEARIGKLAFRQIHPGKYRRAEIQAAQESAKLLTTGDRDGAASAKMRQVVNYYLGMAATDARNETAKIVDRMNRYNKKSVREEIQKAGNDYWEQLVKILNRFEFRKSATLKQIDRLNENINVWAKDRNENDGDGLVLTPSVLDESFVTHWKNVPFEDLVGINASVENIEHVARYSNRMALGAETLTFNKLIDQWVSHLNEAAPDKFSLKDVTASVRGRDALRSGVSQMSKVPWIATWLDGGERAGLSHEILTQPVNDAYDAELNLIEDVAKPVTDLILNRSKKDQARHNRKLFIPEIQSDVNDGNLMGHQVLAVALNTGNESNLRKLILGEGWAEPDGGDVTINNLKLRAVLKHMTHSDWIMVQKIWDQMKILYPQLAEVHRRTTGLTPPEIKASPVQTPFGEFEGGYYPIKEDSNRSHRARQNQDRLDSEVDSMFSNGASIQSSVNDGFTKERGEGYTPLRLSLDVVPAHFQEVIHYITHHDAVRQINKLIRNKTVADTIKRKLGPEEYAELPRWLNDVAKDGREAPTKTFIDDILQRLRFGVTLGIMGFKASTGIIQISGLLNTIAETGLANAAFGVKTSIGRAKWIQAARRILGSTDSIQSAWEFASENSKVLKHRASNMDREMKNAKKELRTKVGLKTGDIAKDVVSKLLLDNSKIKKAVQEASMKHIMYIQLYMVDLPSWHAAYHNAMESHGDEARAFRYADWVIENIQGSGATKDLARIMRSQNEAIRMMTMFMTFFSSFWNAQRDLVRGAKSGKYSKTTIAAKLMFMYTLPVLFDMLLRGEFADDDEEPEEKLQKFLTTTAMYPIQTIPFIRDIANATRGEFGYNISPLQQVIEQGTQTIPEIIERGFTDEEITKGQIKGATKFIGAVLGLPGTAQIWATGEHLYQVAEEGEDLTMGQLGFGPKRQ